MLNKIIGNWFIQLFCILWALFLFLDYINNSGYFIDAFQYFEYTDFLIVTAILVLVLTYFFANKKKLGIVVEINSFRGIYHYVFVLLCMFLIMIFYISKTGIADSAVTGAIIFIAKTVGFHFALAFVFLSALCTGTYVIDLFPFSLDKGASALVSIATGLFILTIALFILGMFGILYQFVVIPLLFLMLLPAWKRTIAKLKDLLFSKAKQFDVHILSIFGYAFLILLIALNLSYCTRVFPVGYDGLGLYMNIPKLISGYHALTAGGNAYNWSLIMSLGFIVFNSTTISILLSVIPGVFCLFVIYKICSRLNINRNWSIFACTVFYSLPNTIWQSRFEEKTDLAFLFITLCVVLFLMVVGTAAKTNGSLNRLQRYFQTISPEILIWITCGCLTGYTFGIKYVAMLSVFALLVVLFYRNAGKYAAAGIFFLNFAVIFALDLPRFAAFENDLILLRVIVPSVFAVIFFIIAFRNNRQATFQSFKLALVFCLFIGLTFIPWAVKNVSENRRISIDAMLSGKSPLPELYPEVVNLDTKIKSSMNVSRVNVSAFRLFAFADSNVPNGKKDPSINRINEFQSLDRSKIINSNPVNNSTEKTEEIRRYLGYETGIVRFISLPYDIAMKSNVRSTSSDTGILILILLPVLMLVFSARHFGWNILKMIMLFLFLIISIASVVIVKNNGDFYSAIKLIEATSFSGSDFFRETFLNIYVFFEKQFLAAGQNMLPVYNSLTTQPLGLCFVIVSLISIPLFFLYRNAFMKLDMLSRMTLIFTFCIIQYWFILSSGIIWYGIAGFSLIPVVIAAIVNPYTNSQNNNNFIRRYIVACTIVWFILILPFQFMPGKFIYSADRFNLNYNEIMERQFVKYAVGENTEKAVYNEFFLPSQREMIRILNNDKKAKVLNVSTFFNYHILNNDARVYQDNQLGIFKNVYAQVNNEKSKLASEFKRNNIKYILVSLNTDKIDVTPDKSLSKKFNQLMMALVNNPEFKLLSTNRLVERPDGDLFYPMNGDTVVAKFDVIGKRVLDPGTEALFEYYKPFLCPLTTVK